MEMFNDKDFWDLKWNKIFDHYQNDPRFAFYIYAVLKNNEKRVLEIGAGSFRDMAKLNQWGVECYGIDFSKTSIEKAKRRFTEYTKYIIKADSFELPFDDRYFDVTYHNGFWGCFSKEDINMLAREQSRVTKKRIIAAVHNAHNTSFVEYFNKTKVNDPIYSVHFFTISEISNLMKPYCSDIKILPVGKGKKHYEDYLINLGLGTRSNLRKCFNYHKMDLLEESERLLCIGTIK